MRIIYETNKSVGGSLVSARWGWGGGVGCEVGGVILKSVSHTRMVVLDNKAGLGDQRTRL